MGKKRSAPDQLVERAKHFRLPSVLESGCAYLVERFLRRQTLVRRCNAVRHRPFARCFSRKEKASRDCSYGQKADTQSANKLLQNWVVVAASGQAPVQ